PDVCAPFECWPLCSPPPPQSLQAKQRTLLQQLDSLDQEREELQTSLAEAEEENTRQSPLPPPCELLDTLQQEKLALEQSILELQANTSQLQEQAQELRERERLLVFFPDLHIPTEMQFESSGNLTEDMESQLQANTIRIEVLERENAQLEALLAKVKAAAEQGVLKVSWVPQGWERESCNGSQGSGHPQSTSMSPGVLGSQALYGDRDSSWGNTGNTAWPPLSLCPSLHLLSAAGHTRAALPVLVSPQCPRRPHQSPSASQCPSVPTSPLPHSCPSAHRPLLPH
uniref:Coiled-coil domain containing 157 n=1 Tax=Cyanistes caeruleus TaxID=156563 RepID=A0A8C0U4F7_CYACU